MFAATSPFAAVQSIVFLVLSALIKNLLHRHPALCSPPGQTPNEIAQICPRRLARSSPLCRAVRALQAERRGTRAAWGAAQVPAAMLPSPWPGAMLPSPSLPGGKFSPLFFGQELPGQLGSLTRGQLRHGRDLRAGRCVQRQGNCWGEGNAEKIQPLCPHTPHTPRKRSPKGFGG